MKATYESEFPDFGQLDVTMPDGFVDASWHNDTMPCFDKKLRNGNLLRIWINYSDRTMRETGENDPRFTLGLYDPDLMWIRTLIESDGWNEIIRTVEETSR